jgi:AcrR family transcriptional regulator
VPDRPASHPVLLTEGSYGPPGPMSCAFRAEVSSDSREKILAAARRVAQAHGYKGLNFRDLAEDVGIRAASIYHHFPSKADLAAAVAGRYWEDSAADARHRGPTSMCRIQPS